jgi:hypothetical protein
VYPDEAAQTRALWSTLTVYWGFAMGNFGLHSKCPSFDLWAQRLRDFLKSEEPCNKFVVYSGEHLSVNFDTTEGIVESLQKAIIAFLLNDQSVFYTEKGYVGQGKNRCKVGDLVCVLLGCNLPMILRPVEDHYELIGEIYIHGIMHGEVMQALDRREVQLQSFELH